MIEMISLEILDKPDSQWNDRLLNSTYGTLYQTKEYASYIQSRLKARPLYLKFYEKDELISQLLIFQTYKGIKKIDKWFGHGYFYSFVVKTSLLPKYTYWTYGPVIFNMSYQKEILETLGNYLVKQKVKFRGSPHPLDSEYYFSSKFNFVKEQRSTFIINLKEKIEKIFEKTNKHSVQKNIRRSKDRGVTITELNTKEDFNVYYQLQKEHRIQNKLTPYTKNDLSENYSQFQQLGSGGFLAWYNEIPIGAIAFSSFNGYINEAAIARSKIDSEKHLYSLDLLRWKIIELGVDNNCRFYDMSGVKPTNRNSKEEGIFRNKKKWGGAQYNYWSFRSA